MDDRPIPLPGERLAAGVEQATIAAIRAKYRPAETASYYAELKLQRENRPTWAICPSKLVRIAPADLALVAINQVDVLLLYVEYELPGRIHQARWGDILNYFSRRAQWDRTDTYVLPSDLSWVIVCTHEHVGETDLVLLLGPVPRHRPDPIEGLPWPLGQQRTYE
jgi:hypothetical protein